MKIPFLVLLIASIFTNVRSCDVGSTSPSEASCAELSASFDHAVASLDTSCDTAADCTLIGGADAWCEPYPSLGSNVGGRPVRRGAVAASSQAAHIEELQANFRDRCWRESSHCGESGVSCAWDAGPNAVACVDHVCVGRLQSCIGNDGGLGP